MILWTVQHKAVYDQIMQTGVYHTDKQHLWAPAEEDTNNYHAHYAYQWLIKQMVCHIGEPPTGVTYPIWGMYKEQNRADGKPDMRIWGLPKGEPHVRMKLDIPEWDVLITDFDMWHSALNYWYQSTSKADADGFQNAYENDGITIWDLSDWSKQSDALTKYRTKIEHSWERMIGFQRFDDTWIGTWHERSFQGTFWELKRKHILSVEHFQR